MPLRAGSPGRVGDRSRGDRRRRARAGGRRRTRGRAAASAPTDSRWWGRWISCSSGWFALIASAERELAQARPTFAAHQIKEKYGTLRLYVEFDHDDDLPAELRAAEPRYPSLGDLAAHLGTTDANRNGPVGDAWQHGYETIFVPAHEKWSARVAVFRESDTGMRAAEDQARRSAAFERLVEQFEEESTTTCDRCGGHGVFSCTAAARVPWYAVRCDECRDAGWILASEWQEWRSRTHPE